MRPKQETCKRGHPLAEAYTQKNGTRRCRACQRIRGKEQYWETRESERVPRGGTPCHHRWAQHVCIQDKGHSRADHRCNCGDTWGVA
jgi:hypothetical protein